jgi:hypothetical protein
MAFLESEVCYLNQNVCSGLPNRVGELAVVHECLYDSQTYDYRVVFEDGEFGRVKESELTKLNDRQKELIKYIYLGNEVLYSPTIQKVIINKVDLVHHQVGINFVEGGSTVVEIEKIKPLEAIIYNLDNSMLLDT